MNIFDRSAVSQVRVARSTDRLNEIETFYQEVIGLPRITSWRDGIDGNHAGYDGLILGMPDGRYHLEFTHYRDGSPCPAPSRDNLLVFYLPDVTDLNRVVARMTAHGHDEVEPENPWWKPDGGTGHTFEDPDGWRVVFMHGHGVGPPSASDPPADDQLHGITRSGIIQDKVDTPMVASGNHG